MQKDELIARKQRRPKGAQGEAWGILNPYGDLWTWQTFGTPEQAMQHVAHFWRTTKDMDLSKFKPVRVKVHVTALREKGEHHEG